MSVVARLTLLLSVLIAGALGVSGAGGVAQSRVLFVPVTGLDSPQSRADDAGVLSVLACEQTADGLKVTGSSNLPPGESLRVAVWPFDPTAAGVGVSPMHATMASVFAGAVDGDFVVTLPWANKSAKFSALAADGARGSAAATVTLGCPP